MSYPPRPSDARRPSRPSGPRRRVADATATTTHAAPHPHGASPSPKPSHVVPGHRASRPARAVPERTAPARPAVTPPTGPDTFAALGVPLPLCAVLAGQDLVRPMPIQTATIPDALAGRDVLGEGQTGSGKTLAFAVPLVAQLAARPRPRGDRRPRALILAPTRELASQIDAVIRPLAAAVGLRSTAIFGGVGAGPQLAALRAGTEIIVGCPGRLVDHLQSRALDLGGIEVTVLDEADHMADVGFLPMVVRLLSVTPSEGQRLLFSATLANGVDQVVRRFMHDPAVHAVATEAPVDMDHTVLVIDAADRMNTLMKLVSGRRAVVFTRTKHRAKQLTRSMAAAGCHAVELHGNLSQQARTANLRAFSDGRAHVLVATDIAARGIHVDEVPLVVHADPPVEHKAYVHRSGRTARAGAKGSVVTIATHDQVVDVEGLLRKAKITAAWQTGTGAPFVSGRGSGSGAGAGAGGRPGSAPRGRAPERSGAPRRAARPGPSGAAAPDRSRRRSSGTGRAGTSGSSRQG